MGYIPILSAYQREGALVENLCNDETNSTIHIITNNTSAVAHIKKLGGTKSEQCRL